MSNKNVGTTYEDGLSDSLSDGLLDDGLPDSLPETATHHSSTGKPPSRLFETPCSSLSSTTSTLTRKFK